MHGDAVLWHGVPGRVQRGQASSSRTINSPDIRRTASPHWKQSHTLWGRHFSPLSATKLAGMYFRTVSISGYYTAARFIQCSCYQSHSS